MSGSSLGKILRPATADLRTAGILPFRKLLPSSVFSDLWPGKQPSWTTLVPEVVFWLMAVAALGEGSMASAISRLWSGMCALLPFIPIEPITEEAFCIARKLLPLEFFRRIFNWVVARFTALHEKRFLWKGHSLKAFDGMKTLLPHSKELQGCYPGPSNQHGGCGRPQCLIVGLVGLLTGICHGFIPLPEKGSEPRAGCFLTRLLKAGDILLADCNFTGLRVLLSVLFRKADFLMRVASNRYVKYTRRPTPSGRSDEYYMDIPIPVVLQKLFGVDKVLTLRVLEYQIKGYAPSRLITSLLDVARYSHDELVTLYHERWRQETHHREWKYSLQVGNLRSHSRDGILKEIFVQLTLNNLVRWTQADAIDAPMRPIDLQFLASKRLLLAATGRLAVAMANDDLRGAAIIYNDLLRDIAKKRILVRPGRSYPRRHDAIPRNKGGGKFAQPRRVTETAEAAMSTI